MPIGPLLEVILYVDDMPRAVAFYRDQLGLPLEYPHIDDYTGEHWVVFDTGSCKLCLHAGSTGHPGPRRPEGRLPGRRHPGGPRGPAGPPRRSERDPHPGPRHLSLRRHRPRRKPLLDRIPLARRVAGRLLPNGARMAILALMFDPEGQPRMSADEGQISAYPRASASSAALSPARDTSKPG